MLDLLRPGLPVRTIRARSTSSTGTKIPATPNPRSIASTADQPKRACGGWGCFFFESRIFFIDSFPHHPQALPVATKPKTLRERVRWLRELVGLGQRAADRLAGLQQGSHGRVESGRSVSPRLLTLEPIAGLYGVTVDWLGRGGERPTNQEIARAVAAARERQLYHLRHPACRGRSPSPTMDARKAPARRLSGPTPKSTERAA